MVLPELPELLTGSSRPMVLPEGSLEASTGQCCQCCLAQGQPASMAWRCGRHVHIG